MIRGDRRPAWEKAVYAHRPGMTDGTRVLLLRLLKDMGADGVVSVPRSKLAAELGIAPPRISERIKMARALGYLDVVRRARPRVTAVYQGTIPDPIRGTSTRSELEGREEIPHVSERTSPVPNERYGTRTSEVRQTVSVRGTESVPPRALPEVRMYPTQVVVGPEDDSQPAVAPLGEERSNEEPACEVCRQLARDGITSGCYDHCQETAS